MIIIIYPSTHASYPIHQSQRQHSSKHYWDLLIKHFTTIPRNRDIQEPKMHHTAFSVLTIFSLLGVSLSAPTRVTTSTSTAAPTHFAPSTCATYYPSVLRQLDESTPNVKKANTAKDTKAFHVAQSVSFADNVKFDRVHQYVVFDNIASGSWDCQLMVSWYVSLLSVKLCTRRAIQLTARNRPSAAALKMSSASRFGTSGSSAISLDVYSASYNASSLHSHSNPKGSKIGIPEDSPFATWQLMTKAMRAHTSTDDHSTKGNAQKTHDNGDGVSVTLTPFGTVGVNPGEYGVTINSRACPQAGEDGTLQFLFEIPSTDSRNVSVGFLGSAEKGAGVYLLANC